MFPIITPVMLNMPELVQAGSLTRLPWPDGSVITARLVPTDAPGTALLMLGSYRLLAQVPPATPMGEVWLMLVNRQMPARFALLSDIQVLQMLAGMLEAEQNRPARGPGAQHAKPGHSGMAATLLAGDASEWPNLASPQRADGRQALPWNAEAAADGNTLLWYDNVDEQPRGMLHRKIDDLSFTLSGRVDLARLGGISFTLNGMIDRQPDGPGDAKSAAQSSMQGWNLNLHTVADTALHELRRDFSGWMEEHRASFPGMQADISAGLPDSGPGGLTERTV